MQMNNAVWARMLAFGLVVLIAVTTILMINVNPLEIGLAYLALLAGVVIVGLMTNTKTGLVLSVVTIFMMTLFNRHSGVYIPETMAAHTATELAAIFLTGLMAGRLGRTIEHIQRQANYWEAHAEAQTVHDQTFGTLKLAWAEIRFKEEMMRAKQFGRPLSVILLQVDPDSDVSTTALDDRLAVLQAIIRLSRSLSQPPSVVTCLDENQVLLILPEYSAEQADELGQRLLDQAANVLYFPDKATKTLGKSISQWGQVHIGVACLNGHDTNAEMLLTQAKFKLTEESMKHRSNGAHNLPIQDNTFIKLAVGQTSESFGSSDR